ncbi:MAG: hypothetical protein R6U58_03260 [Bacteroidales bacterium]
MKFDLFLDWIFLYAYPAQGFYPHQALWLPEQLVEKCHSTHIARRSRKTTVAGKATA